MDFRCSLLLRWAPDHNFANLFRRQEVGAIFGHDSNFRSRCQTEATWSECGGRQGVRGHLMRCLRHIIDLDHRAGAGLLQRGHDLRWQGKQRRADQAQLRRGQTADIARGPRQYCLIHGRHGGILGRFHLIDPLRKAKGVKTERAIDPGAGRETGQYGRN